MKWRNAEITLMHIKQGPAGKEGPQEVGNASSPNQSYRVFTFPTFG